MGIPKRKVKKDRSVELTEKHKLFCEHYIETLSQTEALRRAGYKCKYPGAYAADLMRLPKIQNYIQQLMAERSKRNQITADMVLQELAKIGFANIKNYIKTGNLVEDLKGLEDDKTAAVESIKVTERILLDGTKQTVTTLKLGNKAQTLELLGRHLGIFEEDNRQKNVNFDLTLNLSKPKGV